MRWFLFAGAALLVPALWGVATCAIFRRAARRQPARREKPPDPDYMI